MARTRRHEPADPPEIPLDDFDPVPARAMALASLTGPQLELVIARSGAGDPVTAAALAELAGRRHLYDAMQRAELTLIAGGLA